MPKFMFRRCGKVDPLMVALLVFAGVCFVSCVAYGILDGTIGMEAFNGGVLGFFAGMGFLEIVLGASFVGALLFFSALVKTEDLIDSIFHIR